MTDISDGGAKTTNVAENEEKPILMENQQRSSEPTAVANYEPLSPDTSDAVPTSQTDTSTDQATNLPLFSFLNLPDSGNGTLSAPTIRPVISPDDSLSNMRNIPTGNIIPPQLITTTITTSGSITLPIKPPPQPTYEPLSDDDD
ncbi:hypothetical protein WUBG_05802 [Wuchereria bancrofti]|nr:hypothetical protein WUBG_05802 [Wuchereria bancrofti]